MDNIDDIKLFTNNENFRQGILALLSGCIENDTNNVNMKMDIDGTILNIDITFSIEGE